MKRRIEWVAKMVWGWLCYQVITRTPINCLSGFGLWVTSHAGFYAYDPGYKTWRDNIEHEAALNSAIKQAMNGPVFVGDPLLPIDTSKMASFNEVHHSPKAENWQSPGKRRMPRQN